MGKLHWYFLATMLLHLVIAVTQATEANFVYSLANFGFAVIEFWLARHYSKGAK